MNYLKNKIKQPKNNFFIKNFLVLLNESSLFLSQITIAKPGTLCIHLFEHVIRKSMFAFFISTGIAPKELTPSTTYTES